MYPADATKAVKRRLHEKSESFTAQKIISCITRATKANKQQLVVQKDEVPELLQQMHASAV